MKRTLPLILLAGFAGCGPDDVPPPAAAPVSAAAPDTAGLLPGAEVGARPPLSWRTFHSPEGVLDSIQVLLGGRRVQTLPSLTDADAAPVPGSDVDTVDINFDGYTDLRQQVIWGATGNSAFDWWLFRPDSGRFVHSREYSRRILGYRLDREGRRIVVRHRGGHAGAVFSEEVYRPEGDSLQLLGSVQQDWNEEIDRYLRTRRWREGARWVERVDTFTVEDLPVDSLERPARP